MTDNNEINEVKDKDYQKIDLDNFDDLLCTYHNGNLLRGIYEYGFERPSPIQAKSIPPICDGRDLIAQAQSGSGKTGSFVISALTKINVSLRRPQAIIIANTKELATQIETVTKHLGKFITSEETEKYPPVDLRMSLCIGGSTKHTMANLKEAQSSHILVGTPGRLVDLIETDQQKKNMRRNQGDLLDSLKIFILDEADKLLGEDFREQIHKILKYIPRDCQVCLFSATYTKDILDLTTKFMNNPVKILVDKEKISVDTIRNYYVDAQYEDNKYDILIDLYQKVSVCQAVIFVNSIRKAIEISDQLTKEGHSVGTIHSRLNDIERSEILKAFRRTQTRILVATDIISRGIDVQQVGLVINYDVPTDPEQYIHRVGRSGRYGKLGVAITFVTSHHSDIMRMKNIERNYKIKFQSLPSLDTVNHYLTGINGYNYIDTSNQQN